MTNEQIIFWVLYLVATISTILVGIFKKTLGKYFCLEEMQLGIHYFAFAFIPILPYIFLYNSFKDYQDKKIEIKNSFPLETRSNWWLDGKPHRLDGPAVVREDGTQEWFMYGKRHRTDGPALIRANGKSYWFLFDKEIPTFEQYRNLLDLNDKAAWQIKLNYGDKSKFWG